MQDTPFRFLLMYGKYAIREKASREISFWITISLSASFIPKEKGNYEIVITDEAAVKVELGVLHKILLHINGSLIRMDQNSPYSFENPIRKIDSMNVIIQPEDGLCGQACVAMLAGVTIAEVISVMDCREWQATMGRVISALNYYGIDHTDIIVYTEGRPAVLPKCCIMMEKMGRFCHYLVHYDGKFYDSNMMKIQLPTSLSARSPQRSSVRRLCMHWMRRSLTESPLPSTG